GSFAYPWTNPEDGTVGPAALPRTAGLLLLLAGLALIRRELRGGTVLERDGHVEEEAEHTPGERRAIRRQLLTAAATLLSTGFAAALTPENLLWCFVGVLLGTVIGILPGLGSATGVAILIPVTLTFEPLTALIMLAGIYHGAQFGATITAILVATPGEAS